MDVSHILFLVEAEKLEEIPDGNQNSCYEFRVSNTLYSEELEYEKIYIKSD